MLVRALAAGMQAYGQVERAVERAVGGAVIGAVKGLYAVEKGIQKPVDDAIMSGLTTLEQARKLADENNVTKPGKRPSSQRLP
jgi:hypothetical protein